MTDLQLNPDTSDGFEVFTLAEMRQKVFDAVGFMAFDDSTNLWSLGMIRSLLINRLGLAVALLGNTDTFDNILADVYNMGGYASIGATHPVGVDNLLGTIINDAQRTLFARLEFDKGGVTVPPLLTTGVSTAIDATAVRLLAIAELKAHQGKPDAAGYAQQAEKYLSDLTQRTPPNIVGILNSAILDAHDSVFRRWEMGQTTLAHPAVGSMNTLFLQASAASNASVYAKTSFDNLTTNVDANPVTLLALANVKKKIGQPDAEDYFKRYEQYMADRVKRLPPNAAIIVNRALKDAQDTLYRRYSVFRMERWYTWTTVADQRFYPLYGYDGASSQAPTNLQVLVGSAVTSHNMSVGRQWGVAGTLPDGKVIFAGGADAQGVYTTVTELFDPQAGTFSNTGAMSMGRVSAAACVTSNGKFFIAGGYPYLTSSEVYDPATGTWSPGPTLNAARTFGTATPMTNGRVLLVGGQIATSDAATNVVEIYDPVANTVTLTAPMVQRRKLHTATLLNDGRVFVAGGYNGATGTTGPLQTSEIYDPVAGTWSAGPALTIARYDHGATILGDGRVILVAGFGTVTTDIFDPSTGTMSAGASLPTGTGRLRPSVFLLDNGLVFTVGGYTIASVMQPDSYLYDPVANSWSAGPIGAYGELDAAAAEMQDRRILIAGGNTHFSGSSTITNLAEIYDQTANTLAATGNLAQGADYYVVTAFTVNGESLPSSEVFILAVPANTSVKLSWVPTPKQPFVKGFNIYRGKTSGNEGFIASVPASQTSYIDQGTIPQGAPPPTVNTTPGKRSIDARHVAWVGLSLNGNVWNPLIAGIPPIAYTANISGIPTNYEIRDAIELWPPPRDSTWQLQVKGYFPPQLFESDDDTTTIDWQAILYQTIADVLPKFPGRYDKETIVDARRRADGYIKELTAGTHITRRYIPGSATQRNLIRPVFTGTYETYP